MALCNIVHINGYKYAYCICSQDSQSKDEKMPWNHRSLTNLKMIAIAVSISNKHGQTYESKT